MQMQVRSGQGDQCPREFAACVLVGQQLGQANESIGWCAVTRVCCRGTQAGDGESDGWRPDLIVGYKGKRSKYCRRSLTTKVDSVCTKGKEKFLQAAQLDMRMPGVYADLKARRGYAQDQKIFNTVSQEGDACKVTEGTTRERGCLKI